MICDTRSTLQESSKMSDGNHKRMRQLDFARRLSGIWTTRNGGNAFCQVITSLIAKDWLKIVLLGKAWIRSLRETVHKSERLTA